MEEPPPCERCAQLQHEFELMLELEAAYDDNRRLRAEISRLQHAQIALLEERLRQLERKRRR